MFTWNAEAVAEFLGTQGVCEDNSSCTFSFQMFDRTGTLRVFPDRGEVETALGIKDDYPIALWRLECSEIRYNDELPEEGGPCLVFFPKENGARKSHWIVLGKSDGNLEILTMFQSLNES